MSVYFLELVLRIKEEEGMAELLKGFSPFFFGRKVRDVSLEFSPRRNTIKQTQ